MVKIHRIDRVIAEIKGDSLQNSNLNRMNLELAELANENLMGTSLRHTDLRSANLRGANLSNADLRGADLSGAHLDGANLTCTKMVRVNLSGATLDGACLDRTNMSKAYVWGVSMRGVIIKSANMMVADVYNKKGDMINKPDWQTPKDRISYIFGVIRFEIKIALKIIHRPPPLKLIKSIPMKPFYDTHGNVLTSGLEYLGKPELIRCFLTLIDVRYDSETKWPIGFNPETYGARRDTFDNDDS